MSEDKNTVSAEYEKMVTDRDPYLLASEDASSKTIPSLFPKDRNAKGKVKVPTPYNGFGAMGVNMLANKIALSLNPPNTPCFKLEMDEVSLRKIDAEDQEGSRKQKIVEGLAVMERSASKRLEGTDFRPKLVESLKLGVISGNFVFHIKEYNKFRVYKLSQYVQKLDASGNLLKLITKESVAKAMLSRELREACDIDTPDSPVKDKTEIDVYTMIERVDADTFKVFQEINGKMVPNSNGTYPEDKLPWVSVRLFPIDGESYGRGIVEDYQGDFNALDGLSKAILQISVAASRLLLMIKPGSTIRARELSSAPSGTAIQGNIADVGLLQLNKAHDMSVAERQIASLENRLAQAFLMNSSIQRNGERVTAEEIRTLAKELEDAHAGLYSSLSNTMLKPIINVILAKMTKKGLLPPLPKDLVGVSVITGLDAIGRGHDADKLALVIGDLSALGPEYLAKINRDEMISRICVARGVDPTGLITSDEELESQQQTDQANAMMANIGQSVAPGMIEQAMAQGMPQTVPMA